MYVGLPLSVYIGWCFKAMFTFGSYQKITDFNGPQKYSRNNYENRQKRSEDKYSLTPKHT